MFLGKQIILAGAVVLAGVLFHIIDRAGLKVQQTAGVVKEKIYREAKTITTYVGSRPRVNPLPEAWVLKVESGGKVFEAETAREVFDKATAGDKIEIKYRRQRITGTIKAIEILPGIEN